MFFLSFFHQKMIILFFSNFLKIIFSRKPTFSASTTAVSVITTTFRSPTSDPLLLNDWRLQKWVFISFDKKNHENSPKSVFFSKNRPFLLIFSLFFSKFSNFQQQIPHEYQGVDVRIDNILALRQKLKKSGTALSLNDFIIKAAALALKVSDNVIKIIEMKKLIKLFKKMSYSTFVINFKKKFLKKVKKKLKKFFFQF